MLYSILKKINFKGKIEFIDYKGKTHTFGSSRPYVKVRVKNKSTELKLFFNPRLYIGEAYMDKELTIEEGTIEDFINIITASYEEFQSNHPLSILLRLLDNFLIFLRPIQQLNHISNSKKNVAHHYNIKEDLYRLFLDQDMQYSCGYFYNNNISLDQAQIDKKNHLIKKLQIEKNMSVLDIGCGWGGLALHIAKETGANVKGITLSENQLLTARKRAIDEGIADKVEFALQDYRYERK